MLEEEKKKVVEFFLQKGILIDETFLNKIKNINNLEELHTLLSEKLKSNGAFILNDETNNTPEPQTQVSGENNVNVLFSYEEEEKKLEVQDFVRFFNVRYEKLKGILQNRPEFQNILSLNRLANKKDRGNIALIGMVTDKQVTKNDNIIFTMEDPTGSTKVLVSKNKPELIELAKNTMLDEVIGISGGNGDNIIFANNLVYPDIPLTKELKKSNKENYVVFLSDIHAGSKQFLPDELTKFIKWIKGETGSETQKDIASKVDYVFLTGDLVEGVGIYPDQDSDLVTKDIYEQYEQCAEFLKQIPERIKIIICPGNHDAMRLSEPQPQLYKDFAKTIWELPNAVMVSNPALINIGAEEGFPGFDVLMYHGYSFDYYADNVESIRVSRPNISERTDQVMKFLLQRRHLCPTYSSTLYLPNQKQDYLIIDKIPDFFITGHVHRAAITNYKNITAICGSCWQSITPFQEKVGHKPEPCKVPIVNLKTREVKMLNFGK
ncbi:DNA-directed DNA polymerase II small subunit [Nanoarchaeota archaeon]